jgi:RHS repeat-associated protein
MARFIAGSSLFAILVLFAFVPSQIAAQTDPAAGILPFSTHVSGPIDSVDLATSSVLITIPVRSKAGQIPFKYAVVANNHTYVYSLIVNKQTYLRVEVSGVGVGEPQGFLGQLSMGAYLRSSPDPNPVPECHNGPDQGLYWSVVDSTGAAHSLGYVQTDINGCDALPQGAVTVDGSGYTVNFTTEQSGNIYDKAGNLVGGNSAAITDPDGNQILWSSGNYNDTLIPSGTPYALSVANWVLGNQAPPTPDTYQYTDTNGNTQTVQVNYSSYTVKTNFGCPGITDLGPSSYLPSSINVPDSGTYTITYESTPGYSGDVTGRIAQITLPSGGYVSYTYGGSNNGFNCNTVNPAVPTLTRTVNDNNGNVNSWTYVNSGSNSPTVTETDPAGNQTVYTFGGNPGANPSVPLMQTSASYYQGTATGTPLKTVNTCYNGAAYPCTNSAGFTQKDVYTSLNGTATSWIETKYDGYGNVTEVKSYNASGVWPSASTTLVSDTLNYYGQSWSGSSCTPYASGYINDTPCYTETLNSSGTIVAQTKITYSNTGHPTSTSKWVSGSNWLTTTASYNSNGTVQWSKDTVGNQTTYAYNGTGGCNAVMPTSITHPLIGTEYKTWNCNGGVLLTDEDVNSQTTTYTYSDPFWRETQVSYPDGGSTTTTYNTGASLPWSISTSTAITGSSNLTKTTIYDGIGRDIQAQLTSDPSGTDYVDTTYDALGRKATQSNPHRSSSSSTDGITTYSYDALNRVISVLQPDGSQSTTAYSVICTTVTDEAGNSRKSCTDGLGRLTGVWEAPSSLNYETDYAYDALNNLLSVTQKGGASSGSWRNRSFVYDGLSRLTSATNLESGTLVYSYATSGGGLCAGDPSAVCTKTAPSPNQPATGTATVTATYTYDAMNRLTGESYADTYSGNSATPSVSYGYDGVALTGCTTTPPTLTDSYPEGRRTSMCDGSGGTSWAHDQMGRTLQESRNLAGVTKSVNYTYNLDGSLATLTTPPLKKVSYTYNAAARATKLVDSSDSINFVTSATYAPPGELTGMTVGSASGFAGITTTNAYNTRLQPILLSAGVTGESPVFSECFDFHLGVSVNTSPCSFSASTAGDNGNIYQIVNNRDNTRSQSFTYDVLNRIATGQSSGTQWGETFTIDPWSNLTNRTGVAGKTYYEPLSTSAGTNNQLSGFAYDAAGNMITNGSNSYVYDAENRLIWTSGYRYVYDGDGDRAEKCVAATSTTPCPTSGTNGTLYWRGRGSDPLDETDLSGNVVEEYIYFNGQRVARREVSGSGGTIAVHYYFSDHLGSHGVVENATASACEQDVDYYPYGGEENDYCSTQVAQHYKFTGKERDTESGLDNFGARYEASSLGRFMTPDWAAKPATVPYAKFGDPQTLNLYAYTENGPVNKADADGHKFAAPVGVDSLISDMSFLQGWSQSFWPQPYVPYQTTQPAATTQTGQAQNQKPQYDNPQNEAEARLANVVYNETSSLRPDPNSKPGTGGSAEALHDAREGVAEVANRVIDSGHPGRVAPSELNDKDRRALSAGNADAINAHNDSLAAARQALGGANNTSGDTQYRLRTGSVSPDRPINGKDTNFTYGPFINTIGRRETIVFAP